MSSVDHKAIIRHIVDGHRGSGYITYDEINDALPREEITVEQLDELLTALFDANIGISHQSQAENQPRPIPHSTQVADLLQNVLNIEMRVQKVLFRLPFAITEATRVLRQKEEIDPLLVRKLRRNRKVCWEECEIVLMARPGSERRRKARQVITTTTVDVIKNVREAGLTRGELWEVWRTVETALPELDELPSPENDFSRQDLSGPVLQSMKRVAADFRSPLPVLEKSLKYIRKAGRKVRKLKGRVANALSPIIRKMSAEYPCQDCMISPADLQQEGQVGLAEFFDAYPYKSEEGFYAFMSQAISQAMAAAIKASKPLDPEQDKSLGAEVEREDPIETPGEGTPGEMYPSVAGEQGAGQDEGRGGGLPSAEHDRPRVNIPKLDHVTPAMVGGEAASLFRAKPTRARASRELIKTKDIESLLAGPEGGEIPLEEEDQGRVITDGARMGGGRRLSLMAAIVGRRAEEIVIKHLMSTLGEDEANSLCWVSREGLTPGWDIEYVNVGGEPVKIEVKGTTGNIFQNIDVSPNEWKAAEDQGANYWLYIVTGCLGTKPQMDRIRDPFSLAQNGSIRAFPALWRLELPTGQG